MTTLHRIWLVAIVVLGVVAICEAWTYRTPLRTQHPAVLFSPATTTSVLDIGVPGYSPRDDDWAEPRLDLNGNEIDVAIGDYRVDRRGEMYERHAPDTALLHLSAPEL